MCLQLQLEECVKVSHHHLDKGRVVLCLNIIIRTNLKLKVNHANGNLLYLGHSFTFETDAGVFSKSEVDFGSRVLIDTFEMPEVEGDVLDVGCGYGPIGLSIAKAISRAYRSYDGY